MLAKIYLYTWIVLGAAFLLLTLVGSMTLMTLMVFGFIAFGMVFMGMISVLPATVSHPVEEVTAEPERVSPMPVTEMIQQGAHSLRA